MTVNVKDCMECAHQKVCMYRDTCKRLVDDMTILTNDGDDCNAFFDIALRCKNFMAKMSAVKGK